MNYLTRDENSQKVYLSESPIYVSEILKDNYRYIYDVMCDEGIILKGTECNLFKELVLNSKVVGFCSYDFSSEFITAALNNIYVLPEFRGNGLLREELQKTMVEYNKPSIVEPTRLVVELLVRYGFASRISDSLVASSLEFIIPASNVESNGDYQNEELSTHFYDLNICSSIHFLDIDKGIVAYSSPLNYDIIHYDCINRRKSINDGYFNRIKEFLLENDVEIMNEISKLEERLPVKSYSLEEVVGNDEEFSSYIESLIDDGHVTRRKAFQIKQQMIEEYEAGMILNESLLIRLAYLFEEDRTPSIKSHTDTCPYCDMPTDSHDRFCHFCGINLDYDADEMFESLLNTIGQYSDDTVEDIRYIAYKFLKMISEGIEVEYALMTCANSYCTDPQFLSKYLSGNDYFKSNKITQKGHKFLKTHPLYFFEKYELGIFDYTDFERYFYEMEGLDGDRIVFHYLNQFDDDEALELKKKIKW